MRDIISTDSLMECHAVPVAGRNGPTPTGTCVTSLDYRTVSNKWGNGQHVLLRGVSARATSICLDAYHWLVICLDAYH